MSTSRLSTGTSFYSRKMCFSTILNLCLSLFKTYAHFWTISLYFELVTFFKCAYFRTISSYSILTFSLSSRRSYLWTIFLLDDPSSRRSFLWTIFLLDDLFCRLSFLQSIFIVDDLSSGRSFFQKIFLLDDLSFRRSFMQTIFLVDDLSCKKSIFWTIFLLDDLSFRRSLLQTIVLYPRPNMLTCTLRIWLREIGFALSYGALMLKTWR